MNDKTIAELREWDKKHCDGQLCFESRDVFEKILSRAEQEAKEEPLAVLADRKGLWTFKINHYRGDKNWVIFLGVRRQDEIYDEIQFNGITYPEAEAKARAYLAGLPDKEAA